MTNKRKSLKELRGLIVKEIEYNKDSIESFKDNDNPQVKEMYIQSKATLNTLENVLLYIDNGSKYQFI